MSEEKAQYGNPKPTIENLRHGLIAIDFTDDSIATWDVN